MDSGPSAYHSHGALCGEGGHTDGHGAGIRAHSSAASVCSAASSGKRYGISTASPGGGAAAMTDIGGEAPAKGVWKRAG